jgi:hypothetical protein
VKATRWHAWTRSRSDLAVAELLNVGTILALEMGAKAEAFFLTIDGCEATFLIVRIKTAVSLGTAAVG